MPSYTLSDLRREYAAYVAEMAEADARRLAPRCNVPARREREAAAQREEARAEETRHWNSVTLPRLGASYRPASYMEGQALRWRKRGDNEWHAVKP